MKIAIPIWQGRISPVFDVAGQLLLVDLANDHEIAREEHQMEETTVEERTRKLSEFGVEMLICAGISRDVGIQPDRTGNSSNRPDLRQC